MCATCSATCDRAYACQFKKKQILVHVHHYHACTCALRLFAWAFCTCTCWLACMHVILQRWIPQASKSCQREFNDCEKICHIFLHDTSYSNHSVSARGPLVASEKSTWRHSLAAFPEHSTNLGPWVGPSLTMRNQRRCPCCSLTQRAKPLSGGQRGFRTFFV